MLNVNRHILISIQYLLVPGKPYFPANRSPDSLILYKVNNFCRVFKFCFTFHIVLKSSGNGKEVAEMMNLNQKKTRHI